MENVVPDIFKSVVIPSSEDASWKNNRVNDLSPIDTLVISIPFDVGSQEELQLQKMLAACKLTGSDYHVFHIHSNEPVSWRQLKEATNATKILLLGILPAQLGIVSMMMMNEINNFNQAQWMPTVSLTELLANNPLKQHLWTNVFKVVYHL